MPSDLTLKTMNGVHRALLKLSGGRFGWQASGMPVSVPGNAFLVVRFRNASSAGVASPVVTIEPARIAGIVRTQDFEGVVTWVIGLDSARAFGVSTGTTGQIAIEIDAG